MTEQLDEGAESATPRDEFWAKVLEHEDDTRLPLTIANADGSNARVAGTIRVGDVRATFADPGYQAMMRRARERIEAHPEEFGQA